MSERDDGGPLRDRAVWIWCWFAHALILYLPYRGYRWQLWLLAWAGLYCHSETYADYIAARDWGRARRLKAGGG